MVKLLTVIAFMGVFTANQALAQNGGNGNGAKVGKDGYLLNVIAFDKCPGGDFVNSNRHQIAVQANYTGNGNDKTAKVNKIFLKEGDGFWVQDGNACDNGANFFLPITDANCSNCGDPALEPTFTEYEVNARLVGKPGGKVEVTSCGDGICDTRIGLFNSFGEDYWWNWNTQGRPHVTLVFVPVHSGGT